MKRVYKITAWVIGCIVLLCVCVSGAFLLRDVLYPEFKETKIYPDESSVAPKDTTINVNGVEFRMIGVKGGKIDCKGLKETIELDDFLIGETEVTQELWTAIMGGNPSVQQTGDSLPVENVDLAECLKFMHKLDSVSGQNFYIPSYPQWIYAASLGHRLSDNYHLNDNVWHRGNSNNSTHAVKSKNPDGLGVYDIFGNVAEWTISGSDPLFIVAGGSFGDEMVQFDADSHEYDHGMVKKGSIGFRLVSYPSNSKK